MSNIYVDNDLCRKDELSYCLVCLFVNLLDVGQISTILAKNYAKLRKTALSLTPQAMYNQFKRPSAGSVSELYYIYIKT